MNRRAAATPMRPHPFTDRGAGAEVCFAGPSADEPRPATSPEERRRKALRSPWVPADVSIGSVHQVHGCELAQYPAGGWVGSAPRADGLHTDNGGVAMTLVTADCLPVLMSDGTRVLAAHAGWRGVAAGMLERALGLFRDPTSVTVWVGPAIGACCYEVGEEVAQAVALRAGARAVCPGLRGRPHLDLHSAALDIYSRRRVQDIRLVHCCTHCSPAWASYRRDGSAADRNVSAIWLS